VTTAAEKAADPTTYTALCRREGKWWVITVPELEYGGVTQARTLDEVPATVADLVAVMTGADRNTIEVDVKAHARADATMPGILGGVALAAGIIWRSIKRTAPVS
jgi:hypothetical protein